MFFVYLSRFLLLTYPVIESLAILLNPKNFQRMLISGYSNLGFVLHTKGLEHLIISPSFVVLNSFYFVLGFGIILLGTSCLGVIKTKFLILNALLLFLGTFIVHNPWLHRKTVEIESHTHMALLNLTIISGLLLAATKAN